MTTDVDQRPFTCAPCGVGYWAPGVMVSGTWRPLPGRMACPFCGRQGMMMPGLVVEVPAVEERRPGVNWWK